MFQTYFHVLRGLRGPGRKTLACSWSLAKNKTQSPEDTPCISGNVKATVPRMYSQDRLDLWGGSETERPRESFQRINCHLKQTFQNE